MSVQSGHSLLFQTLVDSMASTCIQLQNSEVTSSNSMSSPFNYEHFWNCLRVSSRKVSNEVTKLSLMYSKDPVPTTEETQGLLSSLETAYVDLLTTFYTLPKEMGLWLHTTVKNAVLCIIKAVVKVVQSLKDAGPQAEKDRLSQTGLVWEACENIESMPENVAQVLFKLLDEEEALVFDALTEIEEEVKSHSLVPIQEDLDVELSDMWSNKDRALVSPVVGLVKTARAVLKKVSQAAHSCAKCDTVEQITELDELASVIKTFSPAVDDLIATVYPPMSTRDKINSEAMVVVAKVDKVLKMVRGSHYTTEDDQKWIDFLLQALQHNDNKLQQALLSS